MSNSLDQNQDRCSVLIWVQTVCEDYQQTTKVAAGKEKVNACTHVLSYCLEDHRDPHVKVNIYGGSRPYMRFKALFQLYTKKR